jgi:hypothetical protein
VIKAGGVKIDKKLVYHGETLQMINYEKLKSIINNLKLEINNYNDDLMNYPAAELRGIKMNFYLINPDAEHRGILLIKNVPLEKIP